MRFAVEAWAPEYGISADEDVLEDGGESVDVGVEVAAAAWAPIPATGDRADRVTFVDGVRRIDARVWIDDGARVHAGVCASVAVGAVVVNGGAASVTEWLVERALFAPGSAPGEAIDTRHARYVFRPTAGHDADAVYLAIHEHMTSLEARVAHQPGCELVVFDGPLRGRNDPCSIGYVKTQRVQYLPDELMAVVNALGAGERTPLFLIGGRSFTRWSCYLRLPGPRSQPLAGIVRIELPGHGRADDAAVRAGLVAATLPRFASAAHKEPRAPQNLYPIGGLEHRLRHLLGDQLVLERSLRVAAGPVVAS